MHKAAASHATDCDLPLYHSWKQHDKTPGMRHDGSLDALLEAEIG
jgi:hypothetical protein